MKQNAVLVDNTDGSSTVVQAGQELGLVRPVLHGAFKGQWEFESFLALPPVRRGYAPTKQGALYHLGFKTVGKGTGAICYERDEDE